MRRNRNSWLDLGFDTWSLALESSSVIGLRLLTFATGGAAAEHEATRMVSEKVEALWTLQAKALTGGLGASPPAMAARSLAHVRRKVRANRRRLSK